MGRSRYKFAEQDLPHFMTCTVLHWIPVFTRPETVNIVLDSLRYLQGNGLKLYAWVVLENHIHLIAQSDNLSQDMARFKSYTSTQITQYLKNNKASAILDQLAFYKKRYKGDRALQFWQEGVHPEWTQNSEMMPQKVEYIHFNPVKRGYVDQPEHWRYSSARDYLGGTGLIEVCCDW